MDYILDVNVQIYFVDLGDKFQLVKTSTLYEYGSLDDGCVGLKENGPKGSGTIRRCGFVGVNVALLGKTCHCRGGL